MFSVSSIFARLLRVNRVNRVNRAATTTLRNTLALEWLEARDLWATYTWLGPKLPGGIATWNTPTNWQLGGDRSTTTAPTNGDSVIFNGTSIQNSVDNIPELQLASLTISSGYSIPNPQPDQSQPQITLEESLTVLGGSMATITPHGTDATINGGSLTIAPNGTFTWNSGTMDGTFLTISQSATLNIASSSTQTQDARLISSKLTVALGGTVNFTSGRLFCQQDQNSDYQSNIVNEGTFNISNTATMIIGAATFTSTGNVNVTAQPAGNNFLFGSGVVFNNRSAPGNRVSVSSGLNVQGGGTSTGPWSVTGQLLFVGGTYSLQTGTQFTQTGSVDIASGATVQIPGGVTISCSPAFGVIGGTLSGGGQLTITQSGIFTDGFISGGVTVSISPTATMSIYQRAKQFRYPGEGANPTLDGSTIQVNGTLYLGVPPTSATGLPTTLTMGNGAIIQVTNGGQMQLTDESGIKALLQAGMSSTTYGSIDLSGGTLTKLANTGQASLQIDGIVGNLANATAQPGSEIRLYQLQNSLGFTILPRSTPPPPPPSAPPEDTTDGLTFSGTFSIDTAATIDPDGDLFGWGEIDGPVIQNEGVVIPGTNGQVGELIFGATYVQSGTGALDIDIADPAVGYDQITVTGAYNLISLAGTLNINLETSSPPATGTVYTIIDNTSNEPINGTFSGLPNDSLFTVGTTTFEIQYSQPNILNPQESTNNVTLTVLGPPTANSQSVTTAENTPVSITLTGTDPNTPPLPLTYTIASEPSDGTLSGMPPYVTYTPNTGYFGPDSFTFTVSNAVGTSQPATVSITVVGQPIANSQSVTTLLNTPVSITLTATDPNSPPLPLTYTVTSSPSNGTLSGTAPDLTYTPDSGFVGTDSFTFTATNGVATSLPATVSITVIGVPTANSQLLTTPENTAISVTLSGTDPDTPPLPLTYTVTSSPSNGAISGTVPNLTYTPNTGFTGTDSFTFTVSNGIETSAPATITIDVTGFGTSSGSGTGSGGGSNSNSGSNVGSGSGVDSGNGSNSGNGSGNGTGSGVGSNSGNGGYAPPSTGAPSGSGTGAIGGYAWGDTNQDGLWDNGDTGLGGVLVELEDPAGDVLMTTTTAANGSYDFTGLAEGSYQVVFIAPTGDTTENGTTLTITSLSLGSGQTLTGINAGILFGPGSGGTSST